MNASLNQHLLSNLTTLTDEVLNEFVSALKEEYADSIQAIVFYGSCMRERNYQNAVLDFYVVVDSYSNAYQKWWPSLLNKLLPPNVFFIQVDVAGQVYQAKYAIVSHPDLVRATSKRVFHSYFWARFAQPFALTFVEHERIRQWLVDIQEQAVTTLITKVHCMLPSACSSKELWTQAFRLTYAAELRAESTSRAATIYLNDSSYYDGVTAAIQGQLFNMQSGKSNKFLCRIEWRLRIWLGKFLSVARLLKATFTFTNGLEYIAWKIKRHTGETVIITNRLRKFPWIFCWPLLWRLLRSGKVR